MNLILKSFSSAALLLSASFVFAGEPMKQTKYAQTRAWDFDMQKKYMASIFGCAQAADQYCAAIEQANSPDNLIMAISAKKQNDDKRTSDRLSVLECCLGVDTRNSCDSLTPAAKKDLDDCRKKVK